MKTMSDCEKEMWMARSYISIHTYIYMEIIGIVLKDIHNVIQPY
jgi:hypothetical protein